MVHKTPTIAKIPGAKKTIEEEKKDLRTEAEKKAHQRRIERMREKKEKKDIKTFTDRVKGFNEKLVNQSDHYDIPRIGPG